MMQEMEFTDIDRYETFLYKQMQRMLHERVNNLCRRFNLPEDDMMGEANYLFVRALRKYDSNAGVKFSTFLYQVLHNGLINYGKELASQEGRELGIRVEEVYTPNGECLDPLNIIPDDTATRKYGFFDDLSALSKDAMELVQLVLLGMASSIDKLRDLSKRLHWGQPRFLTARNEIKDMVNQWC